MFSKKIIAIMFFALTLTGFAQNGGNKPAPLIPMKDFFKNPESRSYNLSPDGKYLAFLKPYKNRLNIHVQKIGEDKIVRVTNSTERDIPGYLWKGNDRLIYIKDTKGDENFRLYAVDKNGENPKDLTPFEKVRVGIIDDLEENPNEMLIQMNKRDPKVFDVFRINVNTGEMTKVAENPGNITGWQTDHNGKLRIAITTDGVNNSILYRENENDEFKKVITTNFKETLSPLFFTFDNKNIYASSNLGRDKAAIVKYDLANNKELEVTYEHPEVDVYNLFYSKKRKKILGVCCIT